ncbi:hypothetical protein DOTSEDRAFT_71710 [Dothistroma septosporum NZE10]|uniref:Zn(2)-C6 fungal-type domain-containing protein n=1 Tax=Dothistroma septosporum (strain NZE10 / CBS 128990) TaxID=675120 RepID=N1PLU8_DOTSN|nr:hypothetical protein DOTSEDRAFT_71710 [Dothistroma septosporum NZE10]
MSARLRKGHTKSRSGCGACKRRRVKCDETLPTCSACQRLDLTCQRLEVATSTKTSSFRRFVPVKVPCTPPPRPSVANEAAQVALHFFCLRTLPILRICQPSTLWDNVITSLLQADDSIRDIAVAIGFFQRLQNESQVTAVVQKQALLAYDAALHSLRLSVGADSAKDSTIHTFSCLLMVLLESLRGSHLDLLVHLRSGLRIAATNECTAGLAEVKEKILHLLQRYRVSSALFGLLAARNTTLIELTTQDDYISGSHKSGPHYKQSAASENYAVIGSSVHLWHDLCEATTAAQRDQVCSAIPEIRAHNAELQASRTSYGPSRPEDQPLRGFAEAQQRLTDLALRSASGVSDQDTQRETASFTAVLDILEESLGKLRALHSCNGDDAIPFSAGIGVIGALCLVALQCQSYSIRLRALDLMELCPRREGLWDAKEAHQVFKKSCLHNDQSSNPHRLIGSMHKLLLI